MFSNCIKRFLSTTRLNYAAQNAEKSLLATLRKKTGYTFANCKKALELHNNDISQVKSIFLYLPTKIMCCDSETVSYNPVSLTLPVSNKVI